MSLEIVKNTQSTTSYIRITNLLEFSWNYHGSPVVLRPVPQRAALECGFMTSHLYRALSLPLIIPQFCQNYGYFQVQREVKTEKKNKWNRLPAFYHLLILWGDQGTNLSQWYRKGKVSHNKFPLTEGGNFTSSLSTSGSNLTDTAIHMHKNRVTIFRKAKKRIYFPSDYCINQSPICQTIDIQPLQLVGLQANKPWFIMVSHSQYSLV